MNEVECRAEFKVDKGDIPMLAEALHIPASFITQRRSNVDGIEGLCMLLKRLAYPCRYSDMMAHFARPVPVVSRGVTLAQGAPGSKFVRAPMPSAEGTRTKRRKRESSRENILKSWVSEICHFLHFGGRFYRILIVRKRHITCQNLQFVSKLVEFYYNLHLWKNRGVYVYIKFLIFLWFKTF